MVDITYKTYSLRKAIASATVKTSDRAITEAIKNASVPKGNVLEFARASALLAIKKTSDVIPDCHPLPVEFASISYDINDLDIHINVEVHTIYKTGVEVEAMHGASIAALVIYDMLKPIDKNVQISDIKLLEKKGGKSGDSMYLSEGLKAAVVVCSDSISEGTNEDKSGKIIINELEKLGFKDIAYRIVPDEIEKIQQALTHYKSDAIDLVIFTGGTGLSTRDVTPEALVPMIERPIPGLMEAARSYGQQRIKTAMLSRGVAGFSGQTLVLTYPGSKNGALEYMQSLFPQIVHVFEVKEGNRHE